LPPLVLSRVEVAQPAQPRPEFNLDYSSADAFGPGWWGPALVTLIEDRTSPSHAGGRTTPSCWARQDIILPRGRASIFMGFESGGANWTPQPPCPTRPYNRFTATAYLGQTVIRVDAPEAQAGRI
jgi:hypothetical protein